MLGWALLYKYLIAFVFKRKGFLAMLLIKNDNTDPAFNLACEEYLLCTVKEPTFTLWQNKRSIIVGKNQNTLNEIDLQYVKENDISVIRRLTGGGAVFHDLGNINYTYIEPSQSGNFNNYSYFTNDLIDYLKTLNVNAELSGRNDLLIDGKKFCGNAQCIKNNNIMHHGCILYSADLSTLTNALKVNPAKIQSKGIKSVSSRVTNVIDHMKNKLSAFDFLNGFESFVAQRHGYTPIYLSEAEKAEIQALADSKYSSWDWNFGNSPDYNFKACKKFDFGLIEIYLEIENGIITKAKIGGDFFGKKDIFIIENEIIGKKHAINELTKALEKYKIDEYISGCSNATLLTLLIN